MKCTRYLLIMLAVVPAVSAAQITTIKRPELLTQPLVATREPSMYVFDRYTLNNKDYLLHYMDDFAGKAHSSEFLSNGIQGMAGDRMGNAYVAVYVGDSEPTYVKRMRFPQKFTGPLKRATAVATDAKGRIYITDGALGQVFRIDDITGTNLVTLGTRGSGVGQFLNPTGIVVDKAGKIYINDYGNDRIVRVDDMNGEGWRTYDGSGTEGNWRTINVKSIAVDSKGRLYYASPSGGKVVRVDDMSGANLVLYHGQLSPESIAIDAQDRIYIADPGLGNVTRIDDINGTNRTVLSKDATGVLWRRPSLVMVYYPRADRTIIR